MIGMPYIHGQAQKDIVELLLVVGEGFLVNSVYAVKIHLAINNVIQIKLINNF